MATTTMEQNGLNSRDLRIKLFDLMKSKGVVDNVKVKKKKKGVFSFEILNF